MTADYRPLSKRDSHDSDLDTLHEGLEPWMQSSLLAWVGVFLWRYPAKRVGSQIELLNELESRFRLRQPLHGDAGELERRMKNDPVFGMDVIDFCAVRMAATMDPRDADGKAATLERLLREGGSAWQVSAQVDPDRYLPSYFLSRRDLETTKDAITDLRAASARPGDFLADAWRKIASRDPDPNGAYDKATEPRHGTTTRPRRRTLPSISPWPWCERSPEAS